MKTTVETILPARFLTSIGVYLQTCAHIEHACWEIYRRADPNAIKAESISPASLVRDKGSTQGLLKKLKGTAKHCQPGIAIRILAVHKRLFDGIEARNSATHGAFFFDPSTETLRIEHFFIRKSDPKGTWRYYEDPIEQSNIEDSIEEADLLLKELLSIRALLGSS